MGALSVLRSVRGVFMFYAYSYKLVADKEEMNSHIEFCEKNRKIIYCAPSEEATNKSINKQIKQMSHKLKAYLSIGKVKIDLFYTDNKGKNYQYVHYMIDTDYVRLPQLSPATAMGAFSNTVKDEVKEVKAPSNFSAVPVLGYNEKFNGQRIEAWGYDINSAYASVILDDEWIETKDGPKAKMIDPECEIGFDADFDIQREGFSLWVFPKVSVPFGIKRFFTKHYQKKQEMGAMYKATGDIAFSIEKQKEKDMLNFPVGCLQNKNAWLRAWIVGKCNERIKSLIDEDTLFWNTDSIVSKRRREDIEKDMGDGLGQWKLEHVGKVAYVGNNYQWNDEIPTYRGIPKAWFPKDYDILKHGVPANGNIEYWDETEHRIKDKECLLWQE